MRSDEMEKRHESRTPFGLPDGSDGQKMQFEILESKRDKLTGILKGDDLLDVMDKIGDKYGIKSIQLKAFREMRDNDNEVYVILKGRAVIAEMKRIFDGG
jgi:hypothetical protein